MTAGENDSPAAYEVAMRPCIALIALALCACADKKTPAEVAPPVAEARPVQAAVRPDAQHVVAIAVTEEGFVPPNIALRKGEPVTLRITRTTANTCATELLIAGTEVSLALPLNEAVEVKYTPEKSGRVKFGCAMGMMISGVLLVD